jgi:hypothetical protein
VAEPSAAPQRLLSLLIRGGGAPEVHVSLVSVGDHGPIPAVAEAGGSSPERAGESVDAVEAAGQSGPAPKTAGSQCAAPEPAGTKRAAPKQGSSDHLVKKAWVRSKI